MLNLASKINPVKKNMASTYQFDALYTVNIEV